MEMGESIKENMGVMKGHGKGGTQTNDRHGLVLCNIGGYNDYKDINKRLERPKDLLHNVEGVVYE